MEKATKYFAFPWLWYDSRSSRKLKTIEFTRPMRRLKHLRVAAKRLYGLQLLAMVRKLVNGLEKDRPRLLVTLALHVPSRSN